MCRWCLGRVSVMCSDCVVMFWWYVGDALVLCWWCLCSVSVMCVVSVMGGDAAVIVMILWCFGDGYWWTFYWRTFRDFQWVPKKKGWLFDVSLLLGSYAGLILVLSRWCPGHVSVVSRSCLGLVSVVSWSCLWLFLVMSRCCFGVVLLFFWWCFGDLSVMCWWRLGNVSVKAPYVWW